MERHWVRELLKATGETWDDDAVDAICSRPLPWGTMLGLPEKKEQDPGACWKGARIVEVYSLPRGVGAMFHFPVVAIRKRQGNAGFEVARGAEDYGTRMSNGSFHGYKWDGKVQGVWGNLDMARKRLFEEYPEAKRTKNQNTGKRWWETDDRTANQQHA